MAGKPAVRVIWQALLVVASFIGILGAAFLPSLVVKGKWPDDPWSGGYAVYVLLGTALVAFWVWQATIDEWMRRHAIAGRIVICLVCGLAAFIALRENLDARFGGVDDHEIVQRLGPDKRCSWREWPSQWWQGEVASFGASGRYRPGYYALRVAECCWWEKSVPAWYASRIVLCGAWLAFIWFTVRRWWGDCLSFAFTMGVLGLPAVGDVFCRLGPSEAFALPATAAGAWALSLAWHSGCSESGRHRTWPWWVVSLGFSFAVLSKENFIPWAALAWLCGVVWHWRTRDQGRRPWMWVALMLLAACIGLVSCAILLSVLSNQGDVYGNSVGSGALAGGAWHALSELLLGGPLLALWPLVVLAAACGWVSWSKVPLGRVGMWTLSVLWLWLSQALFYRSTGWPGGTRYDLPAVLVPITVMTAGATWVLEQWRVRHQASAWQISRGALFAVLLIIAGQNIVGHTMSRAKTNRDVTRGFASWLGDIVEQTRSDPNAVVLLLPERAADHYEYLMATQRFLQYQRVPNLVKYSTRYLQAPTWPLDERLNAELRGKAPLNFPVNAGEDIPAHSILVPFGDIARADLVEKHQFTLEKSLDQALRPKFQRQ